MGSYIYILSPFIVWIVSQTIKYIVRVFSHGVSLNLKGIFWTYVWAGGAPSTHSAILASSLYLVWHAVGFSPIFTFSLAITMLWLFDMNTQHKRQELLNEYFALSKSYVLKKEVKDGYLLDIAGHKISEIVWGVLLGVLMGILLTRYLGA